jgi:hypothetical protein
MLPMRFRSGMMMVMIVVMLVELWRINRTIRYRANIIAINLSRDNHRSSMNMMARMMDNRCSRNYYR